MPLERPAARQLRPARDDFTGTHSETPEIDRRDIAALLEERGNPVPGVRGGPPLVPAPFLFFRPACHGNTKMFPRASLSNSERPSGVPQTSLAAGSKHTPDRRRL